MKTQSMTPQQQIKWLETFITEWDTTMHDHALTKPEHWKALKKLEKKLTAFCKQQSLPVMSADDLIVHIMRHIIPAFSKWSEGKRILSTQPEIKAFIEEVIKMEYDTEHPYFRLHVYPDDSFIVEQPDGTFYCEIENTCDEGPLAELESILFDWAQEDTNID